MLLFLATARPLHASVWVGYPDFTPDTFERYDWAYIDVDTAWDLIDPYECGSPVYTYVNIQGYQDDYLCSMGVTICSPVASTRPGRSRS